MKLKSLPKIDKPTLPFHSYPTQFHSYGVATDCFTRRRGEKLIAKGHQNLKDEELLAILLGTGREGKGFAFCKNLL